jgi:hypothetical protein
MLRKEKRKKIQHEKESINSYSNCMIKIYQIKFARNTQQFSSFVFSGLICGVAPLHKVVKIYRQPIVAQNAIIKITYQLMVFVLST